MKPTDRNGREIRRGFIIRTEAGEERRVGSFYLDGLAGSPDPRQAILITWPRERPYAPAMDIHGPALVLHADEVEVTEPGPNSPAAHDTDALLHRLRELGGEPVGPNTPWAQLVEVAQEYQAVFAELDYRMSRRPYPAPSEWQR